MNPRVKKVIPNEDYTLSITFDNGERKVFDMKKLLNLGVFQELKNLEYFKEVKTIYGSIAWPHGQDVCPDTLYEESN